MWPERIICKLLRARRPCLGWSPKRDEPVSPFLQVTRRPRERIRRPDTGVSYSRADLI